MVTFGIEGGGGDYPLLFISNLDLYIFIYWHQLQPFDFVTFFSETLSVVTFTDLLNVIVKFYDGLESNKSEASIWGRR